MHFTLKTGTLNYDDLKDFVRCFNPENIRERKESERFKVFSYDELMQRDKANLDITWIRDESLEDSDNLPEPEALADEIIENLKAALEEFEALREELEK